MKKLCVFVFICLLLVFLPQTTTAKQNEKDVEQQLEQNIQSQLQNFDFSDAESILQQLNDENGLFGANSFVEKVEQILNGNFVEDTSGFLNAFFKFPAIVSATSSSLVTMIIVSSPATEPTISS